MTGGIVYQPVSPEPEHNCEPPMRHRVWSTNPATPFSWHWEPGTEGYDANGHPYLVADSEPAAVVGAVWQCDCGRYWTVRDTTPTYEQTGGYSGRRVEWVAATWWERRRARRGHS